MIASKVKTIKVRDRLSGDVYIITKKPPVFKNPPVVKGKRVTKGQLEGYIEVEECPYCGWTHYHGYLGRKFHLENRPTHYVNDCHLPGPGYYVTINVDEWGGK